MIISVRYTYISELSTIANIFLLLFSPHITQLLTEEEDKRIRLHNAKTGALLTKTHALSCILLALTYSTKGDFVISRDTYVNLYKYKVPSLEVTLSLTDLSITPDDSDVALSPESKILAVSSSGYNHKSGWFSANIFVWEIDRRNLVYTLKGHTLGSIGGIAFSPNGNILASGGFGDGTVRLWGMNTGKVLLVFEIAPGKIL